MTQVRRAGAGDVDELVRLRALLFGALGNSWGRAPGGDEWRKAAAERFAELVDAADACVLVVDGDDGLAACGTCLTDRRVPSPYNPRGSVAHLLGMVTDPAYRRRGYARAILGGLVEWCDDNGIDRIDLNASPDGAALYREFGFREHPDPTMGRRRLNS